MGVAQNKQPVSNSSYSLSNGQSRQMKSTVDFLLLLFFFRCFKYLNKANFVCYFKTILACVGVFTQNIIQILKFFLFKKYFLIT